jgi:hypothetical protein
MRHFTIGADEKMEETEEQMMDPIIDKARMF